MYLKNKEFVHQVAKKDNYYIGMHGQQNIKIFLTLDGSTLNY